MTALVDFKPVIDTFFTLVDGVIVTVIVPWVGAKILEKLHVDKQSVLGQQILTAASNGAALALAKGQAEADTYSAVDVRSAQIKTAVDYVNTAVPGAVDKLGITPAHLENMVTAQIQKLTPPVAPTDSAASPSSAAPVQPLTPVS